MEITYLGHSCFKLKSKSGLVVYMDPFSNEGVGIKLAKDVADVVTVSHQHEDHNAIDVITGAVNREKPFVIDKEGEYEISGILIAAYKTYHDKTDGSERGKNLVISVTMDGMNVVHLGDLGHKLSEGLVEKLGEVHALLVPVGGVYTIGAEEAIEVIKDVQPYFAVPMHFKISGMPSTFDQVDSLDKFMEKNKMPLAGEATHKVKLDAGSLPDDTQVLLMNA